MVRTLVNNIIRYGKHKVPRFIYHMTNKENYKKIMESGELRTSQDALFGEGIFTMELDNFFRRWRKDKAWGKNSLQESLISHTAKGESELVILKIPTENLDHNKLFIRSQNTLFDWSSRCYNELSNACNEIIKKHGDEFCGDTLAKEILEEIKIKIAELAKSKSKKGEINHLQGETLAKQGNLFKQRKEALEYIYTESIPTQKIQKIGEVNLDDIRKSSDYDVSRPIKSIFTKLLEGTPEVKGAELLTC